MSSVLDCKQIHWISRTEGPVHSQAEYFRKTNHSAPGFLNYLAKAFQRLGVQALQSKTNEIIDKQKETTQTFLKQPAFPVVPTKKKVISKHAQWLPRMAFRDLRSLTEMMRALGYPRFVRFQAEVDFEITQKWLKNTIGDGGSTAL